MKDATTRVPKNRESNQDPAIKKYASLLHILNGEEEFLLDREGLILSSNLEAVNVTGYEEHEIIGKHISIFYPSDEKDKASADLEKACRLGSSIASGLRIKKRDVIFWARMKIKFNADDGTFRVILQDATHRALSKERIRTLKEEYLAIFNNPFVGTFKFRMETFAIQMCNQKTLDILKADQGNDLRFDHYFSSLKQFELFISTLREEKKVEGFKFIVQTSGSSIENWAAISARYFEQQGFVEGILLDVTEQYSQMLELQRVNTELDNFIYHASHDLRSPLTTTMGLINLGLKETSLDTVRSYLQIIQERINHLDSLLKDLISISYNNGENTERSFFRFEEEVNSILKLLSTPDQRIKISMSVLQDIDFATDPVRMRTILRNLLSNSLKYYNQEVADPFVDLSIRVTSSHCVILLKDNGIGIHPQFRHKVYNMFFRATERSEGSGLGLYIVKSMVEKLRGRISLESTLGQGTTFLVTIPNNIPPSLTKKGPNGFFSLTQQQIRLVENSWDYILLNANDAGITFYKRLFSIAPELRPLLKDDFDSQAQNFISLITFAVHKMNSFHDIISDVQALVVGHKSDSLKPEHFAALSDALLWAISKGMGDQWNEEIKQAWSVACQTFSNIMIDAVPQDDATANFGLPALE
ncbi:MAG TPA: ATP-binding protein [Cyclobacteriaceae bacterium]|jgi:PAS domain S-box-containing protein|nr:ATP-binding protein [Cyclobacteriaceae bacterium]